MRGSSSISNFRRMPLLKFTGMDRADKWGAHTEQEKRCVDGTIDGAVGRLDRPKQAHTRSMAGRCPASGCSPSSRRSGPLRTLAPPPPPPAQRSDRAGCWWSEAARWTRLRCGAAASFIAPLGTPNLHTRTCKSPGLGMLSLRQFKNMFITPLYRQHASHTLASRAYGPQPHMRS